jgi:hypothetical protein
MVAFIGLSMFPFVVSANENTSLIAHAVAGFPPCDIADPCPGGAQVEIFDPGQVGEMHAICLIVRNYESISEVYFGVTWDPGWTVLFALDCLPGCFDCILVADDEIAWASWFAKCQLGGESIVLGRIFAIPSRGCMRISQSSFYPGPMTISCENREEPISRENLGSVCVGPGGVDACNEPVVVEPVTWGAIKAQYGDRGRAR